MRALLLLVLVACDADPRIACTTDQQCLSGQTCVTGTCAIASSQLPDAPGQLGDGPRGTDSGDVIDAPPALCMPACTAPTPHCLGTTCVQCITATDCPVTTPCCVANACQLLGC
jgi:hypothetical protein